MKSFFSISFLLFALLCALPQPGIAKNHPYGTVSIHVRNQTGFPLDMVYRNLYNIEEELVGFPIPDGDKGIMTLSPKSGDFAFDNIFAAMKPGDNTLFSFLSMEGDSQWWSNLYFFIDTANFGLGRLTTDEYKANWKLKTNADYEVTISNENYHLVEDSPATATIHVVNESDKPLYARGYFEEGMFQKIGFPVQPGEQGTLKCLVDDSRDIEGIFVFDNENDPWYYQDLKININDSWWHDNFRTQEVSWYTTLNGELSKNSWNCKTDIDVVLVVTAK